jgi:hypothetical protein
MKKKLSHLTFVQYKKKSHKFIFLLQYEKKINKRKKIKKEKNIKLKIS